jgi:hypothetical protein
MNMIKALSLAKLARWSRPNAEVGQPDHSAGQDWTARALAMIEAKERGTRFTSERLRFQLLAAGLQPPHHHNAWGAVIMIAAKRRLIMDTGQIARMESEKAHSRRTPVWVRV